MTTSAATLFGCKSGITGETVVIGLPYDKTSCAHPGCAKAPFSLRSLSRTMGLEQGYLWDLNRRDKSLDNLSLSDAGNVTYSAHETQEAYFRRCEETVRQLSQLGKRVLVLGGDHVVTLPVVRGLASAHSAFQVIHLDAHTDFHVRKANDQPTHANFVSFAMDLPQVTAWHQLGIRTYSRDLPEYPGKLQTQNFKSLEESLDDSLPVYITIDSDAFDPSIFPGVSHPVPQGLTFDHLDRLLDMLKHRRIKVIGADWVEYNPELDLKNMLTGTSVIAGLMKLLSALESKEIQ